ncbi:hypothetical protein ACJX0J_028954 [Zea mays]
MVRRNTHYLFFFSCFGTEHYLAATSNLREKCFYDSFWVVIALMPKIPIQLIQNKLAKNTQEVYLLLYSNAEAYSSKLAYQSIGITLSILLQEMTDGKCVNANELITDLQAQESLNVPLWNVMNIVWSLLNIIDENDMLLRLFMLPYVHGHLCHLQIALLEAHLALFSHEVVSS